MAHTESEISIEEKLRALYELQRVDSEIDKIKILRGELPLEVQDLEDEIAGLDTRLQNLEEEVKNLDVAISTKKNEIVNANALIKRYKEQQENVRNNREFDSLSKEIEFQTLEIELCEKRIREFTAQIKNKKEIIESSSATLKERNNDLKNKKKELEEIIADTQKEEEALLKKSKEIEKLIEARLMNAYKRIRSNARNGLAVVSVERDACGGCFNKIPPQRQMEIKAHKKIIVCEYCGRILVDKNYFESQN
ncbi:MAG TPA: C4-type zinc ribbon domain-containing protein [Bacteroidales bacterium]|nr:C4-type zinc ribbon domain-containing protein [Bacteroidales bacterium]